MVTTSVAPKTLSLAVGQWHRAAGDADRAVRPLLVVEGGAADQVALVVVDEEPRQGDGIGFDVVRGAVGLGFGALVEPDVPWVETLAGGMDPAVGREVEAGGEIDEGLLGKDRPAAGSEPPALAVGEDEALGIVGVAGDAQLSL